ncbi:hypothetical protein EVAR_28552_1 [Eumeta japonica]|uniref:Uncharacterized protein n=1 Tax=Eumeta variegata TaxID=151549 RepID=A0A4C1UY84_EUMVA|nr:hypothetical protein EVAR_28552_1 [Eumeta japonica]
MHTRNPRGVTRSLQASRVGTRYLIEGQGTDGGGVRVWSCRVGNTAVESAISLCNKELEFVNSTVFLGITLDNRLQWCPHINHGVCSRIHPRWRSASQELSTTVTTITMTKTGTDGLAVLFKVQSVRVSGAKRLLSYREKLLKNPQHAEEHHELSQKHTITAIRGVNRRTYETGQCIQGLPSPSCKLSILRPVAAPALAAPSGLPRTMFGPFFFITPLTFVREDSATATSGDEVREATFEL